MAKTAKLRHWDSALGMLPVAVFLAVWELISRLKLFPGAFSFPPFSVVLHEFYQLTANGVLGKNFLSSLTRVLVGLVSGSLAGIGVGVLMGWKDVVSKALNPIISLLYPIPALGWLPLLMLWIGINEILPVTIIFICSFFPLVYNTVTGIRGVDKRIVQAAETLGASNARILFKVLIPLALPNIFTGLRLEAGMAWRVLVAAEMVAIPTGIGALIMKAESLVRVDIILVCLIVLSVMCLVFEKVFLFMERYFIGQWSPGVRH